MLRSTLIALGGIGVGYLLARAVLEKQYEERLDEEIQRTKEFFGITEDTPPAEFVEEANRVAENLSEYMGGEKIVPSVLAEAVTSSVKKEFDTEAPIAYNKIADKRSEIEEVVDDVLRNEQATPLDPEARAPYLVTFAEFDAGQEELGFEPVSVSYFAGDGIVIDEADTVISADRVEQIIGTDNLNKFGTQTDDPNMDPNVIYVRCEQFRMDFEVTRSAGKHSVEVLGEAG